jgi:carbamoyl-phosphate synthase large subunit
MLSVGYKIPQKSVLISSGPARSKTELVISAKMMQERGYEIYTTQGTHDFYLQQGIKTNLINWPDSDKRPNVIDYLQQKEFDLVINIPKDLTKNELDNDYRIRRTAVDYNIPLITNARLASAFIYAFTRMDKEDISIRSWQEY